jgi:hypothetical protein
VDNEFEHKHYEWFWDSDVLFPNYNTDIFGEILKDFSNQTAISIDFINQAVKIRQSNIKHTNDTVSFYLDQLSAISNETDSVTSTNTVFIIVMTLCVVGSLFCVFKMCFTSNHTRRPLFPTYRPREWTRRQRHLDPISINMPNDDNIIRTQRPTPETVELQTQTPTAPTVKDNHLYPSYSAVGY